MPTNIPYVRFIENIWGIENMSPNTKGHKKKTRIPHTHVMKINPMIEMVYRLVCSGVSNGFERKKLVILVNAITRIVMLSICLGVIFNGFERLKLEIVVNANINNAGLLDTIFMNTKINAKANKLIMLKTT